MIRGEVLALGTVGALAIAAAAQGAQRGARASLGEGELPSFSWWLSYTNLKGERWAERVISHSTAASWSLHLQYKGFTRVHVSLKAPRNHIQTGRKTLWMTPRGVFAHDVTFLRSLGSEFLSFDPNGEGEVQVDFQDLPEEVKARATTISCLRRHHSDESFGVGHTAAISELNQGLQKLKIGSLEWLFLLEEMQWAVSHPFAMSEE